MKNYRNKFIGMTIATGVLVGSNIATLVTYDTQINKYSHQAREATDIKEEVEKLNNKLINKIDIMTNDDKLHRETIFSLNKTIESQKGEIGKLKESNKKKDTEIHNLRVKLKKENEKERRVTVKNNTTARNNVKTDSKNSDVKATNNKSASEGRTMSMEATAYSAFCNTGCIGRTATGLDVSNTTHHKGKRVIAVDPKVIPLGSTLKIQSDYFGTFYATAQDTGGNIKSKRIDILVSSDSKARSFGRRTVKVTILN